MGDLIDRQAAIDELKECRKIYCDNTPESFSLLGHSDKSRVDEIDNAIAILVNLPSAQPEPQWIPCRTALPENNAPVNITWINRKPEPYYADIKDKPFTATGHYHNGHWWWYSATCQDYLDEYGESEFDIVDDCVEVIAWMPLPEPYKEES